MIHFGTLYRSVVNDACFVFLGRYFCYGYDYCANSSWNALVLGGEYNLHNKTLLRI